MGNKRNKKSQTNIMFQFEQDRHFDGDVFLKSNILMEMHTPDIKILLCQFASV